MIFTRLYVIMADGALELKRHPGYANRIHHLLFVPIDTGSKADIMLLCDDFLKQNDMSFDAFQEAFIKRDFGTIFYGFHLPEELCEFSERLLRSAIGYIFPKQFYEPFADDKPERTLHEQIFGVFLSYSLFHLQPTKYVRNIHVLAKEMHFIGQMVDVLAERDLLEACYCLFALCSANAFYVVPLDEGFDSCKIQLENKDYRPIKQDLIKPGGTTRVASLKNDDIMQKLNLIHNRYESLKANFAIDAPQEGLPTYSVTNMLDHVHDHLEKRETQINEEFEEEKKKIRVKKEQQKAKKRRDSGEDVNRQTSRKMAAKRAAEEEKKQKKEALLHLYDHEVELKHAVDEAEMLAEGNKATPKENKGKGVRGKKRKAAEKEVMLPPRSRLLSETHSDHEREVHIKLEEELQTEEAELDKFFAELSGR
ncbi:hypothetical protein QR680_014072 [Steinernema hermaphroditum]|uniref:Uncharacterized protein n=1 Tax=Steinernema hermaphroditum TaxID=289476 RepID=A0AA39I7L3_9BILA|nr:hypothetical protein QR680_014072 [Steinernema hermaphroditum]